MRRRKGYLPGGWRTGEVWLDLNDVHWFGEAKRTAQEAVSLTLEPLVVTAGSSALVAPVLAPEPYRLPSRQQRLATRLVPTVAAVAAVGVTIPVALGWRPSETTEIVDSPAIAAQTASTIAGQSAAPVPPGTTDAVVEAQPGVAPATAVAAPDAEASSESSFPTIRWRESFAIGVPHSGRLIDGVRLPQEGPGWTTWDPALDRVPNRPNRLFATNELVRMTLEVIAAYQLAHPDAPRVLIGDLSRRGGGEIDQHASHENGLDIDVYYPRLDGRLRPATSPAQVDLRLTQDLLDRFIAAGAQVIFVGTSVDLQGPGGVVVPYPNHNEHMHVRIAAGGLQSGD
jgi:hypothetical protein